MKPWLLLRCVADFEVDQPPLSHEFKGHFAYLIDVEANPCIDAVGGGGRYTFRIRFGTKFGSEH